MGDAMGNETVDEEMWYGVHGWVKNEYMILLLLWKNTIVFKKNLQLLKYIDREAIKKNPNLSL